LLAFQPFIPLLSASDQSGWVPTSRDVSGVK
jgi:hypothetical protein